MLYITYIKWTERKQKIGWRGWNWMRKRKCDAKSCAWKMSSQIPYLQWSTKVTGNNAKRELWSSCGSPQSEDFKKLFLKLIICATGNREDLSPTVAHKENCGIYSKLCFLQPPAEQHATACICNGKITEAISTTCLFFMTTMI